MVGETLVEKDDESKRFITQTALIVPAVVDHIRNRDSLFVKMKRVPTSGMFPVLVGSVVMFRWRDHHPIIQSTSHRLCSFCCSWCYRALVVTTFDFRGSHKDEGTTGLSLKLNKCRRQPRLSFEISALLNHWNSYVVPGDDWYDGVPFHLRASLVFSCFFDHFVSWLCIGRDLMRLQQDAQLPNHW